MNLRKSHFLPSQLWGLKNIYPYCVCGLLYVDSRYQSGLLTSSIVSGKHCADLVILIGPVFYFAKEMLQIISSNLPSLISVLNQRTGGNFLDIVTYQKRLSEETHLGAGTSPWQVHPELQGVRSSCV